MIRKNGNPSPATDILNKLTIEDLDIKGKRVFIRADFNVPLDENLKITDDRRIRSTLPTINYAIDEGARVILGSHLGRPKGKVSPRASLAPIAKRLQRLLDKDVVFADELGYLELRGQGFHNLLAKILSPLTPPMVVVVRSALLEEVLERIQEVRPAVLEVTSASRDRLHEKIVQHVAP